MPRETSEYVVGDYWLDKRRDGKSPYWQITTYKRGSRQVVYRSTHTSLLEEAKAQIHAYVEQQRAKSRQSADEAKIIPMLVTYWQEKGRHLINAQQAETSFRFFIGFLMQDEAGVNAVVSDMTPALFERFRAWRMKPHSIDLEWGGKHYQRAYAPVVGATIDRHLNDIRAATNYAEANLRIPAAPHIASLPPQYKSKQRDKVLPVETLGQIAWYCYHRPELFGFFALMLGTGVRPQAALAFRKDQYDAKFHLVDMQPNALPQTKKRNAIIPVIRPLRPVLRNWSLEPVRSRKTAWRIMRKALGISEDIQPKDIRHTVATLLYNDPTVPEREVSELLGHSGKLATTTKRYARYSPHHLKNAERALSKLWLRVSREARKLSAVQTLSTDPWHGKITVARKSQND